jgi:hypothetical protein
MAGAKYCICAAGYDGDGQTCTDVDECSGGAATACGTGATACTNTAGSYSCTCGSGYNGTGTTACGDINECGGGAVAACGAGATACANAGGGHSCICGNGYSGTGTTACSEINECNGSNVCAADYPCQDLTPDYTCRGQFADWVPSDSPTTLAGGFGLVADSRNGLVWQAVVDGNTYTWAAAKAYCAGLTSATIGPDGWVWRLPTRAELVSIVDVTRNNPAIDPTAFPSTPTESFWSSSPTARSPSSAWLVDFRDGSSAYLDTSIAIGVRCVH